MSTMFSYVQTIWIVIILLDYKYVFKINEIKQENKNTWKFCSMLTFWLVDAPPALLRPRVDDDADKKEDLLRINRFHK